MEESSRVLQHVEQHGYQSITEMVAALGGNAEHARLVCFDLFEQGQLQRHQRRTGKRGRLALATHRERVSARHQ